MKMSNFIVFCTLGMMVLSHNVFAFDTSEGRYLSGQDLKNTLLKIYNLNYSDVKTYDRCGRIEDSNFLYSTSIEYDLGFIAVVTGEKITQEPDSGYVLFLDKCLTNLYNSYYLQEAKDKEFISLFLNPELKMEIYKYLNVSESNNISYYLMSQLNQDLKNKIIESVFIRVYGDQELIPKDLIESLKKDAQLFSQNQNMSYGIITIIKKAVINDAFLKY